MNNQNQTQFNIPYLMLHNQIYKIIFILKGHMYIKILHIKMSSTQYKFSKSFLTSSLIGGAIYILK